MELSVKDMIEIVNSGGNLALLACVYFIHKASMRLERIEVALRNYMEPQK